MKAFWISCWAIFCIMATATAQKISGVVHLSDGKGAEFATVVLHKAADSMVVKGTLTDEAGTYAWEGIGAGRYYVVAQLMGNEQVSSAAFDYAGGAYTVPALTLRANNELKTVTVTSRKPLVEVQADKTILNVEGTVNSTGLNALELLRKAPGVTIDNNENISVKGKNGVRILIDGRETPLDGKDLAAVLKSFQASEIAAIEVISNPSAKYDASGNAGIINIKLRKNKALGTNGNVSIELVQGITPKTSPSASLNHRNKKINIYGSVNAHYGDWRNTNIFLREQNGMKFDQKSEQTDENRNHRARIGTDWMLNDKHTIGILASGRLNDGSFYSNGNTVITALSENVTESVLHAQNTVIQSRKDLNINLNYRYADTTGRSLNIDVDRGGYFIRNNSYQPNRYWLADESAILYERNFRMIMPTDIAITTAKADYEQKWWKGNLGLGAKISNVRTDNTFDLYNVFPTEEVKDKTRSNRFEYTERTQAAYVNYNRPFGKLQVQTGLRLEHTNYMGDLTAENGQGKPQVKNSYTELFPSAAVTYPFNKTLGVNITYSRRIDRPSYQDLNPFEYRLDEMTYQLGNPNLRPQFTNSFEISPTFKGQPALTLGYSRTRDVFTQFLDTTRVRATYITQANIADQRNYTLTLNAPLPFKKFGEGFLSLTGYRSQFEAKLREGVAFSQAFTAFNLYGEHSVKLPKGFSVQLSGWYNSPSFWGTMRSNAQGAMDVGIKKKVADGKGEFKLRFGDVLRTANWGGYAVFTPGLQMRMRGTWESRTVTLNFSYRFGSAEVKGARQRKTGLEEEGNRIKKQ